MAGKPAIERETGIPCPRCQSVKSKVITTAAGSVGSHATLRRRRACLACEHRWWTQEIAEDAAAPLETTGAQGELRRARGLITAIRRELSLFDRREDRYARTDQATGGPDGPG